MNYLWFASCTNALQLLGHFALQNGLMHALLYCCSLSPGSLHDFSVSKRARSELVLAGAEHDPFTDSYFLCFAALGVWLGVHTHLHALAWFMSRGYSIFGVTDLDHTFS